MTDLTKLKLGTQVLYTSKRRNKFAKCKVVYIFKSFEIPKKKMVIKYYGEAIIDPKFKGVFGPNNVDRVVLKRGKNDYIILPIVPRVFQYAHLKIL